jgi:hypothetical protein
MSCSTWRGIEDRITWFLEHEPSGPGMCAQHTWHSLGGDKGCPPAWGAANANAVVAKLRSAGKLYTTSLDDPPRGALVVYEYGNNGHACLSLGDGRIATTDPSNGQPTGTEPITYPKKWGAANGGRPTGWSDYYNGVTFTVGSSPDVGTVYLSKLHYGQRDSDSVIELQAALNAHTLSGGQTLPITGDYLDQTDEEVRLCQRQHGYGNDPVNGSNVGPEQAGHLFPDNVTIIDDRPPVVDPPPTVDPPDVPDAAWIDHTFGLWKWYSGKQTGAIDLDNDGEWHSILPAQPASGITAESSEHHFLYLRCELPDNRTADRTIETKFVRSDGDATAYSSPAWTPNARDSVAIFNAHFEDGSGLGGQWWVKVSGGNIEITTRYAKTHVYYTDQVEVAAATLMGVGLRTGGLAGELLRGLGRWVKDPDALPRRTATGSVTR